MKFSKLSLLFLCFIFVFVARASEYEDFVPPEYNIGPESEDRPQEKWQNLKNPQTQYYIDASHLQKKENLKKEKIAAEKKKKEKGNMQECIMPKTIDPVMEPKKKSDNFLIAFLRYFLGFLGMY